MFQLCCASHDSIVDERLVALPSVPTPQFLSRHRRFCCQPEADDDCQGGRLRDWVQRSDADRSSEAVYEGLNSEYGECKMSHEDATSYAMEFRVTLERQEGAKWGIDIEWRGRKNLRVVSVGQGIVSCWNLENPSMRVDVGDLIVEINGIVGDTPKLVHEISTSHRLVMRVQTERCASTKPELQDEMTSAIKGNLRHCQALLSGAFRSLKIAPEYTVYDVGVSESKSVVDALQQYYTFCAESNGLVVVASCRSLWVQAGQINGAAKMIPAVPCQALGIQFAKIFFFDDKINLRQGGGECAPGSCNLRDICTGEYVDFTVGQNEFSCDTMFQHTLVHHSPKYNNVLVQVSTLDAFTRPGYFTSILQAYSEPTERVIVFIDVNGTFAWDMTGDASMLSGRSTSELLLHSMFRDAEIRPYLDEPACLVWESQPSVPLKRPESLLALVKRVANDDESFYRQFWTYKSCRHFLNSVDSVADIAWQNSEFPMSPNDFFAQYSRNLDEIRRSDSGNGIADSWLKCYNQLVEGGHAVVINSFRVATPSILRNFVSDLTRVPYLAIDFKLWDKDQEINWSASFSG